MNAPSVSLQDKFTRRSGDILISGVQALVRLMLLQAERDRGNGLRTGGFVSGYRGSPLGTLDTSFAAAGDAVRDAGIVVRPAVNEELGATAVAGTQQLARSPGATVEGVFALWYGKGPGLDRASDAIRHGNSQGASPAGGVVLAVGDDHVAKSSSIVCNSDEAVAALKVPLFYPADPEEVVRYGLHAFAMSRRTGSWTALKVITEVADSTRVVRGAELAEEIVLPEIVPPAIGLHNRWPETPLEQEMRQLDHRLPGILAYVRANRLDRIARKAPSATIGFVAAGKSWLDLLEGLRILGVAEERCDALGIALYKPAMIWPLDPERLAEFAEGLETIVVVEEKGPFLENQIKAALFGQAPRAVYGKTDAQGAVLFPQTGDLTPERIAAAIGPILARATGQDDWAPAIRQARDLIDIQARFAVPPAIRKPFFCSGCPHNRSTVVPAGSRALSGIGCHGLASYNRPSHESFAQMGGEGIHWMGLAPFTDEPHIFANLGDGTYFHSGILAVRQAVAAGLNITYKILYNDAVAMTGGQSVDGELSVRRLAEQLRAEGVGTIVVSTDAVDRYPSGDPVRAIVDRIESRDDLDALQRELRATGGVSVIIYEQTCATEKRRLRKRGRLPAPTRRVFINELVCEGCGDCSVKSNCLSVEPVATDLGTKRRINQSTCNMDYSCLDGFCPSFVSVEGGTPRRTVAADAPTAPLPPVPAGCMEAANQRILVAGVGGTGVVTLGALLSMTSHLRHLNAAVLDQVGMAQKGGAVASHIHIGPDPVGALRIPSGRADLVLVCDQIVGNSRDVIASIAPGRTRVVANADVSITGDFTQDAGAVADSSLLARRLAQRAGEGHIFVHPFSRLAERLLGDAVGANLMMVGFAVQKGWLALDLEAFAQAVRLNGVGVDLNRAAFDWGRRLAVDPDAVHRAAGMAEEADARSVAELIAERAAFLTAYQDARYAARYRDRIEEIAATERRLNGGDGFARAAAEGLFKLMAYKDEYEVARLYTSGEFERRLKESFAGDAKLSFHLAPPILARRDRATGMPRKRRFGPWLMPALRILARLRRLRGTALDPFARHPDRRLERALIGEYEELLRFLQSRLTATTAPAAAEVASLATTIRGYGHVKQRAVDTYRANLAAALAAFDERDEAVEPVGAASYAER